MNFKVVTTRAGWLMTLGTLRQGTASSAGCRVALVRSDLLPTVKTGVRSPVIDGWRPKVGSERNPETKKGDQMMP